MAEPKTQREYRVAWEYARDLAAIRKDENDQLRLQVRRLGQMLAAAGVHPDLIESVLNDGAES